MNENIIHVGAIKLRVIGSGLLAPTLFAMDEATSQILQPFVLASNNINEPVRLTNFVTQKVKLRLETVNLNENFEINRIMIFIKPIYATVPNLG